jgi:hypothetical protein
MTAARRAGEPLGSQLRDFWIHNGSMRGGLGQLCISHPPLADRIAAPGPIG